MAVIHAMMTTLRTVSRHLTVVGLMVLQISVSMAVLANISTIVLEASERIDAESGLSEARIAVVQNIGVIGFDDAATSSGAGLRALRDVPGISAAALGPVPFAVERGAVRLETSHRNASARPYIYFGSGQLASVLGTSVVQGVALDSLQAPAVEDVLEPNSTLAVPAVVTRSLAERLFPAGDAVGKMIHTEVWGSYPLTLRVVGITADFRSASTGDASDYEAVISEVKIDTQSIGGLYAVRRSAPFDLEAKLAVTRALSSSMPGFVQEPVRTVSELRTAHFAKDASRSSVLLAVVVVVTVSSALGVFGMSHYWVSARHRSIAIRRALGASRRDVVALFAVESAIVAGLGVILGAGLAIAANRFLALQLEMAAVSAASVALGAGLTLLSCQIAALIPALGAAKVDPALAFSQR